MGSCFSTKAVAATSAAAAAAATTKVVHADGRVDEYATAVRAGEAAVGSPGCYVCSSEAMAVGAEAPVVPEAEELQPGQLYFLMPISELRCRLSLRDLCRLAVTASAALRSRGETEGDMDKNHGLQAEVQTVKIISPPTLPN